jgi:hypothetical protein
MIISKARSATSNWVVHHSSLSTPSYVLFLDLTNAQTDTSGNGTVVSPTSSVFTTNWVTGYNINGVTQVAYCFAAIPGYSAFGSYTGNGSTDGPFVYCGFRPRWVLLKRTNAAADWWIQDTSRSPYNAENALLFPDLNQAEYTTAGVELDGLSNGFKIRNTNAFNNASGGTYIYAAFAENPFTNALAR